MGDKGKGNIGIFIQTFISIILLMGYFNSSSCFPSQPDDRFLDRDLASPGGHQLASWLIAQLRKADETSIPDVPSIPYRISLNGKRNSELTSSIMGLPRAMIDNGKK